MDISVAVPTPKHKPSNGSNGHSKSPITYTDDGEDRRVALDLQPHHKFFLDADFVKDYAATKPDWGPIGEVTYRRTYSRRKENGTYEEWFETVERVVNGVFSYQKWHCRKLGLPWYEVKAQKSAQKMYELIFNFKFLPPGRGLWMAGTSYVEKYGGAALNNCSSISTEYLNLDFANPFTTAMDFSMLGIGVGSDTKGAGKVTICQPEHSHDAHVVEDSRDGWIKLVSRILNAYVNKNTLPDCIDYNKVRPAGAPIKGFGGTSAGPAPLRRLVEGIHNILNPMIGKPITAEAIVDLLDIIGVCVVSGNVRRSALLILGENDDKEFMRLKDPELHGEALMSHRWASNNSILAEVGMDYAYPARRTALNGEPGYLWLKNCQAYGRMIDPPDWKDRDATGTNPSMPAGTLVGTQEGIFPIELLEGKVFKVKSLDGTFADAKCFLSGENKDVLEIGFGNHVVTHSTPEHRWPVKDGDQIVKRYTHELKPGDLIPVNRNEPTGMTGDTTLTRDEGFMVGYIFGDGSITRRPAGTYTLFVSVGASKMGIAEKLLALMNKYKNEPSRITTRQRDGKDEFSIQTTDQSFIQLLFSKFGMSIDKSEGIPSKIWTSNDEFIAGFVDGLLSTDGCVSVSDKRITLVTALEKVATDFAKLISFYGVVPSVSFLQTSGIFPNGKDYNKTYDRWSVRLGMPLMPSFRRVFTLSHNEKQTALDLLANQVEASEQKQTSKLKAQYVEVKWITPVEKQRVWDITVFHDQHVFPSQYAYTGNCSEQTLVSGELCCLCETFPSRHDSYEEYEETLKYAYLYAKSITLVPTHNRKSNAIVLRNRRIGMSQSGIVESFAKHGRRNHLRWCDQGYRYLRELDETYSNWLCVPKSRKITSVKPSGTVSLLPGVTPGIHYPHAKYYYRTIRLAKNSQLLPALVAAGYRIEDDLYDAAKNTAVVYFPIEQKNYDRSKDDLSMWEQLENAAAMQAYWADNQVSVTITFKKEEAKDIEKALELYESRLKSVSFLPVKDHSYVQAPYQSISESEYLEASAKLKPINFAQASHEVTDKFCDGESCTL